MKIVMVAIALTLIAVAAARADQYGFVSAPYTYADEYRQNEQLCPRAWHQYQPGYHSCSGESREEDAKEPK